MRALINAVWPQSETQVSVNAGGRVQRRARAIQLVAASLILLVAAHAQTTATIHGTVSDASGSVVAGATVTLTNEASNDSRVSTTNGEGFFAFPAILPGSYKIKIEAKGFKAWDQPGISVNAADQRNLANIVLGVGAATESVTVEADQDLVPVDSGERKDVLSSRDIDQLALEGRNVDELLKTLTGAANTPLGGTSNTVPNFFNQGAEGSSVGNGLALNGAAERGGTAQLADGVDINDPGCNCYSIAAINPEMTQEVTVQMSNFGADSPKGPTVVNSISKSGTSQYHGSAYVYARNWQLDANDWQTKTSELESGEPNKRGGEHYYYPGGNFGGPIPLTQKKAFFWFGYEHFLQNLGNSSFLTSYIPDAGMLAGNFTSSDPLIAAVCPTMDANGNNPGVSGNWCGSVNGTVLPNGTTVTNGQLGPADPGAAALAKIWPAANANPLAAGFGGANYVEPIPAIHNGYTYRARVDYNITQNDKIYISFQYGNDAEPTQGNGAHIYWTPAYSIPYPGGGLQSTSTSKALSGHFVHVFSPTLTNEFLATWGWASNPVAPPNPSAAFRSTLGYPTGYGTVFNTGALLIPSYSSAGAMTFPDFSQQDIFEAGHGSYLTKKEQPSFADNVVKVWGTHTIKIGAYTETADNEQGSFESPNGSFNGFGGLHNDVLTGNPIGSANNPVANFMLGIANQYSENSAGPAEDLAAKDIAAYIDDSWKVNRRLTVEAGFRFEHISHWYDRAKNGIPVWIPALVASDFASGKAEPGLYWHGIDPGIPTSGLPNPILFVQPRFGIAWDVFGTGRTVVRGGWGAYRWNDQYNDYANALIDADNIQNYNLNSSAQKNVLFSEIGSLTPGAQGLGSVTAFNPGDNKISVTHSYNLTISQQVKWNSLFEIAYVGSSTSNVLMGGGSDAGTTSTSAGSFVDQNKVPLGAFFKADPVTGIVASDPEAIANTADYAPFGAVYGSSTIAVPTHVGYSNYNALQTSWNKRANRLTFNLNFTWSKALGTVLNIDPFNLHGNYAPALTDRPYVFNASYAYNLQNFYRGDSRFLSGAANGWSISGITTYQSGLPIQQMTDQNLNLSLQFINDPRFPPTFTSPLTAASYYGTNAALSVQPTTPCDPGGDLTSNQRARLQCFSLPTLPVPSSPTTRTLAGFGPSSYDVYGPAYWDSDVSIYKTFHIGERQSVQFRASAFNFLNHPLQQFSGSNQVQLKYNVDYVTHAITVNPAISPTFGFLDSKNGAPNQRILELSLKYSF
jgi:hypothetical protein